MVRDGQLFAGAGAPLARRRQTVLGGRRRGLGRARAGLRRLHRLPPFRHRGAGGAGAVERGNLAAHRVDLAGEARGPFGGFA